MEGSREEKLEGSREGVFEWRGVDGSRARGEIGRKWSGGQLRSSFHTVAFCDQYCT